MIESCIRIFEIIKKFKNVLCEVLESGVDKEQDNSFSNDN